MDLQGKVSANLALLERTMELPNKQGDDGMNHKFYEAAVILKSKKQIVR